MISGIINEIIFRSLLRSGNDRNNNYQKQGLEVVRLCFGVFKINIQRMIFNIKITLCNYVSLISIGSLMYVLFLFNNKLIVSTQPSFIMKFKYFDCLVHISFKSIRYHKYKLFSVCCLFTLRNTKYHTHNITLL